MDVLVPFVLATGYALTLTSGVDDVCSNFPCAKAFWRLAAGTVGLLFGFLVVLPARYVRYLSTLLDQVN
jgi:hypothetical protein